MSAETKSQSASAIKKRKWLTLEQKLDIIKLHEEGASFAKIGRVKEMDESSVRKIVKKKDQYKSHGTASYLSKTIKNRSTRMINMERLLSMWIEDLRRESLPPSQTEIQAKALGLYNDLKKIDGGETSENFTASRGWFFRFKKRKDIYNVPNSGGKDPSRESESEERDANIAEESLEMHTDKLETNKQFKSIRTIENHSEDDSNAECDTMTYRDDEDFHYDEKKSSKLQFFDEEDSISEECSSNICKQTKLYLRPLPIECFNIESIETNILDGTDDENCHNCFRCEELHNKKMEILDVILASKRKLLAISHLQLLTRQNEYEISIIKLNAAKKGSSTIDFID